MVTKKEKREMLDTLAAKLVGLLGSQQAQDAGIEEPDVIPEGTDELRAAIGFMHEGEGYFLTLDPA